MGTRFRRTVLRFAVAAVLATEAGAAQNPAEAALPDAPSPGTSEAAPALVHPMVTESKQQRPSFASGMSARQKYALAYRRIVSPQLPMKAGFVSGWELATETGPDIPTNGWGPFAERVGYNAASISTTIFFDTAFVPALMHQDPRYFPMGGGPVKSRLKWAVRSEFVGIGDDGRSMPNYANLVGFALSSVAINAFSPRSSAGYGDTIQRYTIKIGVSAGLNVVREFGVFDRVRAIARHSKSADESYERGCQEKSLLPTLRESVMISLASSLIPDGEAVLRV